MASGKKGGASALLLLMVVICGVGGWNYHRNWTAEAKEQGTGPLAGYDSAGLEQLAEAYRAEIGALEERQMSARAGAAKAQDRTFLGERVGEFEKVQRSSAAIRGLSGELGEREARLRDIEHELAYRSRVESGGIQLHLSRLTGI